MAKSLTLDGLNLSVLKDFENGFKELSVCFGRDEMTIRRWIRNGQFPDSQIKMWTKATVMRWIEEAQPSVKEIKTCAKNFRGY